MHVDPHSHFSRAFSDRSAGIHELRIAADKSLAYARVSQLNAKTLGRHADRARRTLSRMARHAPRTGAGVGIRSARQCVDEVRKVPFKGVFGNPGFGFRELTLDVLNELPYIEAVWFWDVALRNVDALYSLTQLSHFGVHPKRPAIDFSRLRNLNQLVWFHKPSDSGVRSLLALESLHVWHYRDKTKNLANLTLPSNLVELDINWANVETLDGLPMLPKLRRLEVHRCRNLRSFGDIAARFPLLEHLVVAACGRVEDGEGDRVARQLPNLKHAYVKDGLVISGTSRPR
jgi:hypothetical protein